MLASLGSSPNLNAPEGGNVVSASTSSALLNCFAANLLQTASPMTPEAPTPNGPSASHGNPEDFTLHSSENAPLVPDAPMESTANSGADGASGSSATPKEIGIIPEAGSLRAGDETITTPGAAPMHKGQGVKPGVSNLATTPKPNSRSRRAAADQSNGIVLGNVQSPLALITSFQSQSTTTANLNLQVASQSEEGISAPAWISGHQETSNSSQSAGTASGLSSFPLANAATWAANATADSSSSRFVQAQSPYSASVNNLSSTTTMPSERTFTTLHAQTPNPTSEYSPVTPQGPGKSSSLSEPDPPIEQLDAPQVKSVEQPASAPIPPNILDAASPGSQPSQVAESAVSTTAQAAAPTSATRPSRQAGYEALFENLPNAEESMQFAGNASAQAALPAKSSAGIGASTAAPQSNDASRTMGATSQSQSTTKSGDSAATTARGATHSAQTPANAAAESSWQQFTELGGAEARILSSSSAAAAASPQAGSTSLSISAANSPQTPAPAVADQFSGAAPANSSGGASSPSSGDSPAAGQSKSGQQNASSPAESPVTVTASTPATSVSPATGASTNPLMVAPPNVPMNHAGLSTPQTPQAPAQPPANLSAWQNYDGGPGKIVQSAALNNSATGAEMRVELRTSPLGPLEVHTVVHDGSVGAEIRVQGPEAHTLLTTGLPSLERALGQQNLRVENLSVYQDPSGGGTSTGGGQDAHTGSHPSMQRQTLPWGSSPQPSIPSSGSLEEEELTIPATGLSIRA